LTTSLSPCIEKYYAAHIKTNLDAAAINIVRPKPKAAENLKPATTFDTGN